MSMDKEKSWQAYLDGELSAGEASEFEEGLSAEARERVGAEMRFENALADTLGQDAECPDDVWARTRALIAGQEAPRRSVRVAFRRWYWGAGALAAAATLAFLVSLLLPVNTPLSPAIVLAAESVEELASYSETAAGLESVQAYLDRQFANVTLSLPAASEMSSAHHSVQLLGARMETSTPEPVVELLFGCCGYPVKVVMAKRGSATAGEIGRAAADGSGQVQATRVVGGYVTAVVGDHPAHGLLDILSVREEAASS